MQSGDSHHLFVSESFLLSPLPSSASAHKKPPGITMDQPALCWLEQFQGVKLKEGAFIDEKPSCQETWEKAAALIIE